MRVIINQYYVDKKPADIDQIPLTNIACNFDHLRHVLLALLNEIFSRCVIPLNHKSAIVRPLLKRGNKKDMGTTGRQLLSQ